MVVFGRVGEEKWCAPVFHVMVYTNAYRNELVFYTVHTSTYHGTYRYKQWYVPVYIMVHTGTNVICTGTYHDISWYIPVHTMVRYGIIDPFCNIRNQSVKWVVKKS